MTLTEQVYTQTLLLAGELNARQQRLLQALCAGTTRILAERLREGITPEDCKADFIASASLMALANLGSIDGENVEQITAGDFTLRKGSRDAASNCLKAQAELMIAPYLKDRFLFGGI